MTTALDRSQALWNRSRPDLRSDEQLAQLLDRGELATWRELYALAKSDPKLRRRIGRLLNTVPLPFAGFWRAVLASLGESVDWSQPLPESKDL
jgi:hypothetical protein